MRLLTPLWLPVPRRPPAQLACPSWLERWAISSEPQVWQEPLAPSLTIREKHAGDRKGGVFWTDMIDWQITNVINRETPRA